MKKNLRIFAIAAALAVIAVSLSAFAASSRAGTRQSITTTPTVIFDSDTEGRNVIAISVGCNPTTDAATTGLLVNVEGMHGKGAGAVYVPIAPGGTLEFRRKSGISKVWVKGDGGTAIVDWGVTEEE